jgi:hypothetical protein
VRFKPWEGDYYDNSPLKLRLLILGESHYRKNDDPEPEELTTIQALKLGRHTHRFWRNISALVGEHQESYQPDIWDSVLFYNYVQHVVGDAPRQRPDESMWTSERTLEGFREILEIGNPQRILVIGKQNWRMMAGGSMLFPDRSPIPEQQFPLPPQFIGRNYDSSGVGYWYPTTQGRYALCAPIFHPGYPRGFYSSGTRDTVTRLLRRDWKMPKDK